MTTLLAVPRTRGYSGTFLALGASWLLLLSIFHVWPVIDIRISEMFFSGPLCQPKTVIPCGYFTFSTEPLVKTTRWVLYALPYAAAGIVIGALALAAISAKFRARLPVQRLWIALISLALSTGLITNAILKAHWGRPRPIQTDIFGGALDFMSAGSFGGACERNCSFISGEASGAGWLVCLLLLLPPRYRAWIAPPVIAASVATAFFRVAVGAHYASDAILGWLLSVVVFAGLLSIEARLATTERFSVE